MAGQSEPVLRTFLFSDMVSSTDIRVEYRRKRGDLKGEKDFLGQVQGLHNQRIDECILNSNGEVMTTEGDSYVVAFRDAREAVDCAVAIQRCLINDPILIQESSGDLPQQVQVRIGVHSGPVTPVRRAGRPNYEGLPIAIARRIEDSAWGEQVLISEETRRQVGEIQGIRYHKWPGYPLKGLKGVWTLVEVLWDDRAPRRPKAGLSESDRQLLLRYLREVWDASVRLKLTTIDRKTATDSREAAELDLAAVFTDLDVQDTPKAEKELIRSHHLQDREPSGKESGRLPVMAAISGHPKLVVLGDPGSGKSTLVNFLALCLAGEGLRDREVNVHRFGKAWQVPILVPIRILLRDYAARGLPQGKSLWQFFRDELATVRTPDGDLSACLPAIEHALGPLGDAILLLDGLDEVPEANRRRVDLKILSVARKRSEATGGRSAGPDNSSRSRNPTVASRCDHGGEVWRSCESRSNCLRIPWRSASSVAGRRRKR